jgi:Ca2+-binding EF-hand superfamily protein
LKSLDKENDGLVDATDLRNALCSGGEALQEKEVEAVFQDFVINEGKVRIEDLIEGLFKMK